VRVRLEREPGRSPGTLHRIQTKWRFSAPPACPARISRRYSRSPSVCALGIAMIAMKMVPASTGGWGDAETGTCSWGRAVPAYHLGRWNCLTRLSTPLMGPPGWRPCSLNAQVAPDPLANPEAWSPPSAQGRDQERKMIGHPAQQRSLRHRRAARRSGPGLLAVKCARLKLWWKTRHARAAYRRLFDDVPPRKRPL
jgi:hypothetical protein